MARGGGASTVTSTVNSVTVNGSQISPQKGDQEEAATNKSSQKIHEY